MYRTPNFNPFRDPPPLVEPAYRASRLFFVATHSARKLRKRWEEIRADQDLTEEGRSKRLAEVEAELRSRVDSAWEGVKKVFEEVDGNLSAYVEERSNAPLCSPVPADAGAGTRALAERQEAVANLLARQVVDGILDRALAADQDGAALAAALEGAAESEDGFVLHMLEKRGLARVRREGSAAQVAVLEGALAAAREARLDDGAKLALDHADVLGQVRTMVEAVRGDTLDAEGFLAGRAPALAAAVEYLGSDMAGLPRGDS